MQRKRSGSGCVPAAPVVQLDLTQQLPGTTGCIWCPDRAGDSDDRSPDG